MKIQRVHIRGYQSHKDSTLQFSPGLNVITGPSDNGKTAIIRALKKVFYDTPLGADFINLDMDTCSIVVEVDKGSVTRVVAARDGKVSKNEYVVVEAGAKPSSGQRFAGFGRTVPTEVVGLTGIHRFDAGGESIDLTFSGQLDSHFVLKRGSVWAKLFGRATGVDTFDRCAQEARNKASHARQQEKFHREQTSNLEERHKVKADSLDRHATVVDEIVEMFTDLSERAFKFKRVESLVQQGKSIRQRLSTTNELLGVLEEELTQAAVDLDTHLQKSKLCPYSGEPLPDVCVKGIRKRV